MEVKLVSCEQCDFAVPFNYDNKTFFFCKTHKFGVNVSSEKIDVKQICKNCNKEMERYNLASEDNSCPFCGGYLSVMYVNNNFSESENKQSEKQEFYIEGEEAKRWMKALSPYMKGKNQEQNTESARRVITKPKFLRLMTLLGLIIILSSLFYWFEWRPSEIRKQCSVLAENSRYIRSVRNNIYRLCLTTNGLKPESLYVNTQ